jgi:hypothetical protein
MIIDIRGADGSFMRDIVQKCEWFNGQFAP